MPLNTLLLGSALAACVAATPSPAAADDTRAGLKPCRLTGVEHGALCGTLQRPLDPAAPQSAAITVHYAVLPALARNRKPDPVFFFAGGPGQGAIELADSISRMLARLSNRRDIVLIDQRGTGKTAPLRCDAVSPLAPQAELADIARAADRIKACAAQLAKLPHGDMRHYTTWVAMQDAEAVRQALGATQVNLVGGSYGTRAALEYLRQFPAAVRRVVIDGVAPPDMVLPAAFSTDNQAALDAMFAACDASAACKTRYPALRDSWRTLLASLPREVKSQHPVTGQLESWVLDRDMLMPLVRGPLYVPWIASALPLAVHEAGRGRLEPLVGLAVAMNNGSQRAQSGMAEGMHFAVVCSEDVPRLAAAVDAPGADFADSAQNLYRRICPAFPRGPVPAAFYTVPPSPVPVLVLSGGADPVTPPRHGERVAKMLGPRARHVVVPQAGHGTMGLPCMRDVLFRFIDAADEAGAASAAAGGDCAAAIPRPPAFLPLAPPVPAAAASGVGK